MQTLYHKPSPDSKDLEFGKIIRHISEIFVMLQNFSFTIDLLLSLHARYNHQYCPQRPVEDCKR